jgi:predicted ATPase
MGRPFNSISLLSVNRGDQSRMYSAHGNMELNELLFQFDDLLNSAGKNKIYIEDFINNYLNELNIGAKLTINKIEETAFTIKIKSLETRQNVSLSDLGFGYSQFIPILLKIASLALTNNYGGYSPSILLLEEPEANLHPNFQSKLADLIVDAGAKFNIQFLIETHSEYLIRKLQYLTAKEKIKPEDSVIYYFHDPNNVPEGEEQVKELRINEDGSLTGDFGSGFFDEADRIAIELYRLQRNKTQMN